MVFTGEVPIGLAFDVFGCEEELGIGHVFVDVVTLHKKHGVEVDGEFGRVRSEGVDSFDANDIDGSFGKFVEVV